MLWLHGTGKPGTGKKPPSPWASEEEFAPSPCRTARHRQDRHRHGEVPRPRNPVRRDRRQRVLVPGEGVRPRSHEDRGGQEGEGLGDERWRTSSTSTRPSTSPRTKSQVLSPLFFPFSPAPAPAPAATAVEYQPKKVAETVSASKGCNIDWWWQCSGFEISTTVTIWEATVGASYLKFNNFKDL